MPTIAEGHLRENPETGYAESTQEDQELLTTSTALLFSKQTSGSLFFLNVGPTNIETKKQTMTAKSTEQWRLS